MTEETTEQPENQTKEAEETLTQEEEKQAQEIEKNIAGINLTQVKPVNSIITEETAEELDDVFNTKEQENIDKVEAALFIAGRYLNLQDLIMLTDVNPIMLKEILKKLEKKYSTGAIRLISAGESWKMDVAEKFHYLINKLATGTTEFTKAEQETLAVIAYKQPIKQSVVIKIRGNKAYDHIHKFVELGLVQSKKIGHTNELNLSEDFYDYFHVQQKENKELTPEN